MAQGSRIQHCLCSSLDCCGGTSSTRSPVLWAKERLLPQLWHRWRLQLRFNMPVNFNMPWVWPLKKITGYTPFCRASA